MKVADWPAAAVVIAAYEEADSIGRTLDSLDGQDAEVIVVVGGDDGTDDIATEHPAVDRVLPDEEEDGPSAARNQGARAADAPVVCFTDADTVVPNHWVAKHRRHYTDDDVVGVGGPLRPTEDSTKHRVLFKLLTDYWYRAAWPVGFVQQSGNNCSYRRSAFLDADGFDEEIPFMEDTELSLRMKQYGRVVYDKECPVYTSTRRQSDQGYLGLFLIYARGYLDYFVLGRRPDDGYFK
ncbi:MULTISPECIES: glycosyltransferase family 2 protein [unclassified Haladaptatus]|uniref:glycosyltransferase n=1 Tax=unclassified Haladaptatus TaxID=2622732 RepID=UPI0023E7CA6E|nr:MULTISPECIES: glycosyltransferase [unclassified Haladaptatus]